ncbi:homeodomain-interacting protein kinase 1-like [Cheilinus undulatus]|uniref:homeodomain-interacting protein kinase 1-like n=1 Tax=Cheilinus undulatus TaxID=241271 RepID=UPI001BD42A84|nr:homeodomain-interacting protein kinase 1-like [Cheilinus undulatus]
MSADISTAGLQTTETLYSCTSAYSVLEIMGEGCFGKVAKCVKESTKEMVAVKILKNIPGLIQDVDKEEAMLEAISTLNPDKTYLVKFYERFRYMGQTCLVFEMLDINLYTMIEELGTSLYVHDIRPIAHQLLVALDALRGLGIIHSDIKPDNVMVANRKDQNVRAKLIDFGVAKKTRDVKPGLKIQPRGYRAPEVALGLPFNESIDMWGVGCILAYLYLGDHLFSYNCEYQMMSSMVKVLGMPDDELLRSGMYTRTFFTQEGAGDGSSWRLLTPEEFKDINGTDVKERVTDWELPSSLDDLVHDDFFKPHDQIEAAALDMMSTMEYAWLENPVKFEKSHGINNTLDIDIVPKFDSKEEETYILIVEGFEPLIDVLNQCYFISILYE